MTVALSCLRLSKSFGDSPALADVDLSVRSGEIHVLLGENGAGKSTLVKIAAGVHRADAGQVLVNGAALVGGSVHEAQAAGIHLIHQEPRLFEDLDVATNMFLDSPPRRYGCVDWSAARRQAAELLRRVGSRVDPTTKVRQLSVADRQLVDIAAALRREPSVLIVDEPTASLTPGEVDRLFGILRDLRGQGVAMVFIGHRLEEVMTIADRITILRDGRLVKVVAAADTNPDDLVRAMAGRALDAASVVAPRVPGPVMLRVRDLASPGAFEGVNLDLRAGEIVGLAGLVGAGRTEIAEAIFGVRRRTGTVEIGGLRPRGPADAVRAGLAYVPEDRGRHGLALRRSIQENLTVGLLRGLSRYGIRRPDRERAAAAGATGTYLIRARDLHQPVGSLSGGNQQKVVLAKWLLTRPRVVIVDEPTRGVDVGAKAEIHRMLGALAVRGVAILIISSEIKELRALADRVVVAREGRLVGELSRAEATDEQIIALATRHPSPAGTS